MSENLDEIKRLEDEIRELYESKENTRRRGFWDEAGISNDYWHGIPKNKEVIPFIVELEREAYSKVLGFSLRNFYLDPYCYVLNSLRIMAFKFKNFNDCTPIGKSFTYYPGAGFEKSIFGGEQIYTEQDAWMARENIIKERVDIESLQYPDFYKSGSMPFTHEFYEQLLELVDEDFKVVFPQWSRSPWGLAWHLRGIDDLLIDSIEDCEWVRKFLNYLTKARERWSMERVKFLNTELTNCNIYNDEVNSPIISPKIYEDLIRPTEIELSRFFGGVNYWHSCGNTTPFQKLINEIPNLHMVHVSPWSSISNAKVSYDHKKTVIEVALHPNEDVINPSDLSNIKEKLKLIKEETREHRSTVRADGIQILNDMETDMSSVYRFIDTATKVLL